MALVADTAGIFDASQEVEVEPDSDGATTNWSTFGAGFEHWDRLNGGSSGYSDSNGIETSSDAVVEQIGLAAPSSLSYLIACSLESVTLSIRAANDQEPGRDRDIDWDYALTDATGSLIGSGTFEIGNTLATVSADIVTATSADLGYLAVNHTVHQVTLTSVKVGSGPTGTFQVSAIWVDMTFLNDVLIIPFGNNTGTTNMTNSGNGLGDDGFVTENTTGASYLLRHIIPQFSRISQFTSKYDESVFEDVYVRMKYTYENANSEIDVVASIAGSDLSESASMPLETDADKLMRVTGGHHWVANDMVDINWVLEASGIPTVAGDVRIDFMGLAFKLGTNPAWLARGLQT